MSLVTTGPAGIGSERTSTSSSDALPQIPHDAVATKWRSATREASNADARWTVTSSSGCAWVAGSPCVIEVIAPASSISPSVRRNPTASSSSWPGVRIVTATSTGA